MNPLFLLLIQTAQPDIALEVNASARRVTIERRGEASLEVDARPDGGSAVRVDAPSANGRRTMRNVNVRVRAEARIADPAQNPEAAETARPQ